MSIQKRNGKYYASVYSGYVNGKRIYEKSELTDKKKAKIEHIQISTDVIKSGAPRSRGAFKSLAELWFKMREKKVAITTYKMNLEYYNLYIKEYFEEYEVKDITPTIVMSFSLSLDHAPATYNKIIVIIKLMLEFAVDMNMLYDNPCRKIKFKTVERHFHPTWTEEQIGEFLSLPSVKKSNGYIPLLILFSTGMRPGEVCGLRWCDFITDHFTPCVGIGRERDKTTLKNNKAHDSVYIPDYLIKILNKHKAGQRAIFFSNGSKLEDESFINVLEPDMRVMTPHYLSQMFQRLLSKTDFPKVCLYEAVRHSFGTNMMRKNINPKKVAEAMRHTSVKTTLDNYSQVNEEMKKELVNSYNIKIN